MKNKLWLFIFIAIVITLGTVVYQYFTGPSYPRKQSVVLNHHTYLLTLPRTHNSSSDCNIDLKIPDSEVVATVFFKRVPSSDEYASLVCMRNGESLQTFLPSMPPSGKLAYYIELKGANGEIVTVGKDDPVIIRYRGEVPTWAFVLYIALIVLTMLSSNYAGILAIVKHPHFRFWIRLSFWLLLSGGIMGCVVQYYVFGMYWTGIPLNYSIVENKMLIVVFVYAFALLANFKKPNRISVIVSTFIMLILFALPGMQNDFRHISKETEELRK